MKKFASLIFILAPITEAYYFPGTSINFWKILIIIVSLSILVFKPMHKQLIWPPGFKAYFIYGIISSVIGALYFSNFGIIYSSLLVSIIYVLALLVIVPRADVDYCKKYYGYTVTVACVIFILQELMYQAVGYRFSGMIPFLDVPYEGTSTADFMMGQAYKNRSSSIFLEPAHFAQYCSGYLAILLGENYRRKRLISVKSIALTAVLFFTISGNAILLTLIAWCMFFILYFKKSFFKFSLAFPILIIGGFILFNKVSETDQGQRLLDRQEEIQYKASDRISSGTMRIYRGYFVYGDMPLVLKILGVGTSGTDNAIEESTYFWMFGKEKYINNVQKILIGTGFVGLVLFLIYGVKQMKMTTIEGKILMMLFIGISVIEYCWLFPKMLIFCGLAWLFQLQKHRIQSFSQYNFNN